MQSLGGVTVANLQAKDQRVRQKLEIEVNSVWVDLTSLAGVNYLKSLSVQLGGAGVSAEPIAASWSAVIANDNNIFHPHHPTSAWSGYFTLGRKVRISIGGNYGGSDYLWQRVIGYMDVPRFSMETQELTVSGSDYSTRLTDFALRSPDNYWGTSVTLSSVETDKTYDTNLFSETDAADPANDADFVTIWTTYNATVESVAAGAGFDSDYAVQFTKGTVSTTAVIHTQEVNTIAQGTIYEVQFRYRRGSGSGTLACYVYDRSYPYGTIAKKLSLSSGTAVDVKFRFVGTRATGIQVNFVITDTLAGTSTFRIDDLYIRAVTAKTNTRYPLPDACNGPYYATLDGTPYWLGNGDTDWFYDEDNNVFYFGDGVFIDTGTNNLIVYYYTTQTVENVVADILAAVSLYADRAAALAAMHYTATGTTVPRVWFDAGTKAIEAIRLLCELVNYRFWFDYAGVPHFLPAPTAAAPAFEQYDNALFATSESYQDLDGVHNAVIIEGIEQGMYATAEDKKTSRLNDSRSDSASIVAYLERSLALTNHLFQDQTTLTAMCATLLAADKDPKWYIKFDASFFPAPLELGDTVAWTAWFSSSVSAMKWGIIRAAEISEGRVVYTVEVSPAWPGPVFGTATLCAPTVILGGAKTVLVSALTATATPTTIGSVAADVPIPDIGAFEYQTETPPVIPDIGALEYSA